MRKILPTLLALLVSLAAAAQTPLLPREYRAVWFTTLQGLDWPKQPATSTAATERQQQELCRLFDQLQTAGINTVFFQARIRGTVAYPSHIEPWDAVFAGRVGKSPGYDPLAFAIDEAHKRGMELHAWVVAFPSEKFATVKALGRQSLARRRPEMCCKSNDQYILDPGVPETADYLASICREIAQNYDIDGIHLDYIRYPESAVAFNDSKTYKKYGGGRPLADWRRENVNRVVRAIHKAVKREKPWAKLSCSPVGKYADLPRQSSKGWNARDAVYQDAVAWLNDSLMDALFPMMYFDGQHFYPFVLDWRERCPERAVAPGLGIYFLSKNERDWPLEVVSRQLTYLRDWKMNGYALFRTRFLTDNTKGLCDWLANFYNDKPALTPPALAPAATAPVAPDVELELGEHDVQLSWTPSNRIGVRYNVYRLLPDGVETLSLRQDSASLHLTPALPASRHLPYAVCAIDRYGRESEPAIVQFSGHIPTPCDTVGIPALPMDVLRYEIFDARGRRVATSVRTPIDVSRLGSGFYEVRAVGFGGTSHRVARFRR